MVCWMGAVVGKAKQKLQCGGDDGPDHDCPLHGHVGVGEDIDFHPDHPLPKGLSSTCL